MKFEKNETIVTAFGERASGPGWGNLPIWVIVRGADHSLREECIQPEDQTIEMHALFNVSHEVHSAMRSAVESALMRAHVRRKKRASRGTLTHGF